MARSSEGDVRSGSTIGALAHRAAADPATLESQITGWVLVGRTPSEATGEWSFRTLSSRTIRDKSGGVEAILDESFVVHILKKSKPGPFASTVLIGRSRSNDICIAHSSISKLHARIRVADDGLFLSDASSSNGTSIDTDKLVPGTEHRLAHGQHVSFGGCTFQVFEPGRFLEILARFSTSPPL